MLDGGQAAVIQGVMEAVADANDQGLKGQELADMSMTSSQNAATRTRRYVVEMELRDLERFDRNSAALTSEQRDRLRGLRGPKTTASAQTQRIATAWKIKFDDATKRATALRNQLERATTTTEAVSASLTTANQTIAELREQLERKNPALKRRMNLREF